MTFMFKKMLSLVLALALMFSLCSCAYSKGGAVRQPPFFRRALEVGADVLEFIKNAGETVGMFFLIVGFWVYEDWRYSRVSQQDIEQYVRENEALLQQVVALQDETLLGDDSVVKSVSFCEAYCEFLCVSMGLAPDGATKGFFYTDAADPYSAHGHDDYAPSGSGVMWHGGGDNTCYMEHICGNFYFFEETW